MNKKDIQRINDEIRQVLVKEWDPIGIKDEPRAQDEYDSYIAGVFNLLARHGSDKEIEDYLWKIIEDRIHLHPRKGATQNAVKALRSIRLEKACRATKAAAKVDLGGRGK
jgi:hypothetical protein